MKSRYRPKSGRTLPYLLAAVPAASFAFTLALPAPAAAQAAEQPTQNQPPAVTGSVISEIIITGNKTLNSEGIIASSGHKLGDPCSNEVLLQMQESIFRTGNFGWRTNKEMNNAVQISASEKDGKCKIEIVVDENPKIDKDSINVEGSGPVKPEIIRELYTETAVFSYVQFESDLLAIDKVYTSQGYRMSFTQDTDLDPEGRLKIGIVVTRVAEIKIAGNNKTRRKVVLREMQTKEGDFFNEVTFQNDLRSLYNLQIFDDVRPSYTNVGAGLTGITLNLPERKTGQVLAGIGFSNRAQLIGTAELTDTNFQGMGRTVSLQWQTGGAVGRSSIIFNFGEPWFDKQRTSLNVSLFDRVAFRFANNLSNSVIGNGQNGQVVGTDTRYNEQRTGGTITLRRPYGKRSPFGRQLVLAATLRGENVRPDPLALTATNASILQNGPILATSFSVSRDTRDVFIDPVSGGFQNINLEVGFANLKAVPVPAGQTAPAAFGGTTFLKSFFEVRQYFSLAGKRDPRKLAEQKSAIALRAYLGMSAGRLPFFEQFFVGGAESLRGYREDRFWGENVLLGSIELRQPIARSLKGVVFMDIGTAWGGEFQGIQLEGFAQSGFSPHVSVGLGLRVGSPLGLISLDYGYGSEGGRTHIGLGQRF